MNMFAKTKRLAVVALVLLASCDTLTGIMNEKSLWTSLDIQNYDFVYHVSCFCGANGPNPVKLSIRDGVVSSAAPVGTYVGPMPALSTYPTIDSLFVILEKAQRDSPGGVTVDFDPTYHYPTSISIDPVKNAVDDEVTYTVGSFLPVIK